MISDLQEHECYELLSSTTVGRIGFVRDGQVHILPMNYRTTDRGLLLRTSSSGVLRRLAGDDSAVSFEVDFHDDLGGTGWSVLMHGTLRIVSEEEPPETQTPPSPWAGPDRETPLRFTIDSITGRRVRRERH
ncbi:pyridoxamine 5'-phosphate oxidase family protein [Microbacterium sp. NPDC077644]|uniref:pyridoxamine 5'-phosphate oxidase family protein n=1 Tax=Microbacterium sp. NPDC077644 TaxID=3155055 RepID=UPI00344BADCE